MGDKAATPRCREFGYARTVAPMLWVLVCIASIELVVTHLIIGLWWPQTAIALSALTFAIIAVLVRQILTFGDRPVAICGNVLAMRVGNLKSASVPLNAIAEASADIPEGVTRDRAVLNLALIAYPNVIVRLAAPMTIGPRWRRRDIVAITHRLDDPARFIAAFAESDTTLLP